MMASESLRGYGRELFERDRWKCRYCGLDCSRFELWLFLCLDHIIPMQQQNEVRTNLDDSRNYATACRSCNGFGNRTKFVIPKNVSFEEQVANVFDQKKKIILERRNEWYEFWSEKVKPKIRKG